MHDSVACPHCQRRLLIPEGLADQMVQCPGCRQTFAPQASPPDAIPVLQPAQPPMLPPYLRPMSPAPRYTARRVLLSLGVFLGIVGLFVAAILYNRPPARNFDFAGGRGWNFPGKFGQAKGFGGRRVLPAGIGLREVPSNKALSRELSDFFTALGGSIQRNDMLQIAASMDGELFNRETELLRPDDRANIATLDGVLANAVVAWVGRAPLKVELRKIHSETGEALGKDFENRELAVTIRYRLPDDEFLRLRWRVVKKNGAWRVFDLESLGYGTRLSVLTKAEHYKGWPNYQEIAQAARDMIEVRNIINTPDKSSRVKELLDDVEQVDLPVELSCDYVFLRAKEHDLHGRFREALADLENLLQAQPDMWIVHGWLAAVHNSVREPVPALRHLDSFERWLGEESFSCLQRGAAHSLLDQTEEAARWYRKSLQIKPRGFEALNGLVRCLTAAQARAELGPLVVNATPSEIQFEALAKFCLTEKKGEALFVAADALQSAKAPISSLAFYLACGKALSNEPEEAVRLFKIAPPEKRKLQLELFFQTMLESGHGLYVYDLWPNKVDAFRRIAFEFKHQHRPAHLQVLAQVHEKQHPRDPLLHLVRAEILGREQRYAEADAEFARAIEEKVDPATLETFRGSRIVASYYAGAAESAYREIEPHQKTFEHLADLCVQNQNDALLEKLLAWHEKSAPNDLKLLQHRMHLYVQRQQFVEAIAVLKKVFRVHPFLDANAQRPFLALMALAGQAVPAYDLSGNPVLAFEILMEAMVGRGKAEEMQRLIDAHRVRFAHDVLPDCYEAELHFHNREWAKAHARLQPVWASLPEHHQEKFRYVLIESLYNQGKWRTAYLAIEPASETFRLLARSMWRDKDGVGLASLASSHIKKFGSEAFSEYQLARGLLLQKKPADAFEAFVQAYHREKDWARKYLLRRFAVALDETGFGFEGYQQTPDTRETFRTLAAQYVRRQEKAHLAKLIAEHRKRHPGDPWGQFFAGELFRLEGKYAEAEQEIRRAVAENNVAEDKLILDDGLRTAMVLAGHVREAFAESNQDSGALYLLTSPCIQQKKADALAELLAEFRKRHPKSPAAAGLEIYLLLLKQEYAAALERVEAVRKDPSVPLVSPQIYDQKIKAHLGLKRFDDALAEAHAEAKTREGNYVNVVFVHAVRGGPEAALAELEKHGDNRFLVGDCYQQIELGALLRSEAFRAFREKHPEPNPDAPDD